ncbi:hypothetical protein EDB19DRAFT_1907795 [Suillus lakei]|nr:hypothetical protein EDB19DRAFT_1907795 [Suillus lakei]
MTFPAHAIKRNREPRTPRPQTDGLNGFREKRCTVHTVGTRDRELWYVKCVLDVEGKYYSSCKPSPYDAVESAFTPPLYLVHGKLQSFMTRLGTNDTMAYHIRISPLPPAHFPSSQTKTLYTQASSSLAYKLLSRRTPAPSITLFSVHRPVDYPDHAYIETHLQDIDSTTSLFREAPAPASAGTPRSRNLWRTRHLASSLQAKNEDTKDKTVVLEDEGRELKTADETECIRVPCPWSGRSSRTPLGEDGLHHHVALALTCLPNVCQVVDALTPPVHE